MSAADVIEPCSDHPDARIILVESGYARVWTVQVREDGSVTAYDDKFDLESGAGDDHFQCGHCLRRLAHNVDFSRMDWN